MLGCQQRQCQEKSWKIDTNGWAQQNRKIQTKVQLKLALDRIHFPAIVAKQFLGQRSTGGHIGQQGLTQVLDTISLAADLVSSVQMRVRTWVTAQRMEEKKWTWERRKHLGGIISAWIPRVGRWERVRKRLKGRDAATKWCTTAPLGNERLVTKERQFGGGEEVYVQS